MTLLSRRVRRRVAHMLDDLRDFSGAYALSGRHREVFKDIETYCMFLGYGRSGHSLLGALLDAHENILIANEFNVLRRLKFVFNRNQLFYLLMNYSKTLAAKGRITAGYDYRVPNQWQGRFTRLRVIGDKKGGGSSEALKRDAGVLDRLDQVVGVPVRCIHFVRNPYDNITTMAKRRNRRNPETPSDLSQAIDHYFSQVKVVDQIKQQQRLTMLDIWHEDFMEDPQGRLDEICRFLGVEASQDYLNDCASIVYKKPHRSRDSINWPADLKDQVAKRMRCYAFLRHYSFNS